MIYYFRSGQIAFLIDELYTVFKDLFNDLSYELPYVCVYEIMI